LEEGEKVTIQVHPYTYLTIKKTRDKLSKHELFTWVKRLTVDEFLDVFFGLSEVSRYCRETFLKVTNELNPEDVIKADVKEKRKEKVKLRVTHLQRKVIEALSQRQPLLPIQLEEFTGIKSKTVHNVVRDLSRRNIVRHTPTGWMLNINLSDYELDTATLTDKITELLRVKGDWVSTSELTRELKGKRKSISCCLWKLHAKGVVERKQVCSNKTLWRIKA